jgi:hypothetical protein
VDSGQYHLARLLPNAQSYLSRLCASCFSSLGGGHGMQHHARGLMLEFSHEATNECIGCRLLHAVAFGRLTLRSLQ